MNKLEITEKLLTVLVSLAGIGFGVVFLVLFPGRFCKAELSKSKYSWIMACAVLIVFFLYVLVRLIFLSK